MIINEPKEGQVLVYLKNGNQKAINPDKLIIKNKELGQTIIEQDAKIKAQDKLILDLVKKNRMIFEILLMLIEQANLNLTKQQLLLLKNKGGNENV